MLIVGDECCVVEVIVFFKQKTAYEVRISDWSSDVCSSDLHQVGHRLGPGVFGQLDVAVRLEGVGAAGVLGDLDEARVHGPRAVADSTLEQQVHGGVGGLAVLEGVVDERMVAAADVGREQVAASAADYDRESVEWGKEV